MIYQCNILLYTIPSVSAFLNVTHTKEKINSFAITPPSGSMFVMTVADCLNMFTKPGSENTDSQRERAKYNNNKCKKFLSFKF